MIFIYGLVGVLVVLFLFYKWLDFKASLVFSSTKKGTGTTPEDYKKVFEPIYFRSQDGIDLSGWFVSSNNISDKTIIVCHGINQNKSDVLKDTIFLTDDFNLFYFDFRGYGESKGGVSSFGIYETKDMLGAVDFLKKFREEFSKKIFVYAPSFSSITVSKLNDIEGIDGVLLVVPVIDFKSFIISVSAKMSIPFMPDFLIKKHIRSKNININDKIRNFSMPVVVITNRNESEIFNLISAGFKEKIEIDKDNDFKDIIKKSFYLLSTKTK